MPELPPNHPLKVLEKLDAPLLDMITSCRSRAIEAGALSKKNKLLIALALDASEGAQDGVKTLAQAAIGEGATKEEIMEALRVAYYICGAGAIYTAARALKDVFPA